MRTTFTVTIAQRKADDAVFAVLHENGKIMAAFGPIVQAGDEGVTFEDTLIRWDQWGADLGAEIANNPDEYRDDWRMDSGHDISFY